MEGKTIQVELAGNILEATGLAVVNYNNVDYLIYSLGEEYTKEGSTYDKIYISQKILAKIMPHT